MPRIKRLKIIGVLSLIPIAIVGFLIVREIQFYQNRQLLNSCQSQKDCQGRIEALENLVKAGKQLEQINLSNANLSGANLSGANLSAAILESGILKGANLDNVNLYRANLSNADISESTLINAKIWGANFNNANLTGIDARFAYLWDSNFIKANLKRANLSSVNLTKANLNFANLSNAKLSEAKLYQANLTGLKFYGAKITDANFRNASLEQADFRSKEATGLGLTIVTEKSDRVVSGIYQNTPAMRSGIKIGDRIIKINGKEIEDLEISVVNQFLFNKLGTNVTLTISRNNFERDYSLTSENFILSVIGLNPQLVQQANNWNKACYDISFRKELGLAPEQTEACSNI